MSYFHCASRALLKVSFLAVKYLTDLSFGAHGG